MFSADALSALSETSRNRSKCELISLAPPAVLPRGLEGFRLVTPSDAELLGAPILDGTAMDRILTQKLNDLQRAADRMELIASHDALVILRHSVGSTKLQYILRASPCASHPLLSRFDALLRRVLGSIANCDLNDLHWIQASLPVRYGGLGIRSVDLLAPSAFFSFCSIHLALAVLLTTGQFPA